MAATAAAASQAGTAAAPGGAGFGQPVPIATDRVITASAAPVGESTPAAAPGSMPHDAAPSTSAVPGDAAAAEGPLAAHPADNMQH